MAHVNLVSTICCRPWRSGSFPLFRGTLTPIKQPGLLTPVAKMDRKVCGTERSYYCCSGLGSVPATLRACAQEISIGGMARCWCEGRDAGMSVCLYHRMPETRFWII